MRFVKILVFSYRATAVDAAQRVISRTNYPETGCYHDCSSRQSMPDNPDCIISSIRDWRKTKNLIMSNWFNNNKADDEELLIANSEDEEDGTSARKTDRFFQDLHANKVWSDISRKVGKSGMLNFT